MKSKNKIKNATKGAYRSKQRFKLKRKKSKIKKEKSQKKKKPNQRK